MNIFRYFVRRSHGQQSHTERPMTVQELADFDDVIRHMNKTFKAIDKLFDNARHR